MPLYEYECKACETVHEVIQKFSDAPMSQCPSCKGPVSKLMSVSGFALKGSGWYTTDYKRAGQSQGQKKKEGGDKAPSSDSSTKKAD